MHNYDDDDNNGSICLVPDYAYSGARGIDMSRSPSVGGVPNAGDIYTKSS
jgi:hypothetical protein